MTVVFPRSKENSLHFSPQNYGCVPPLTAVPGQPTGVTLLEALKDYMVLGWTPPADNGGADVRGYFVDYRTVKGGVLGQWHEMNHQALTAASYKVTSR